MSEINDNEMKHALKQAEKKGRRKGLWAKIRNFFLGIICGMLILTLFTSYMHGLAIKDTFKALFTTETAVEDHDLTLINHRIFGYKVADFADAILGDEEQLKKLEVYSREVSDVATLTQAGLFKLKAFSKYQYITYNGKAIYTVDLSGLSADDITLDEETKVVTSIRIRRYQADTGTAGRGGDCCKGQDAGKARGGKRGRRRKGRRRTFHLGDLPADDIQSVIEIHTEGRIQVA